MNARMLATFVAIWLGLAMVGGIVDGQILGTSESDAAQQILQADVLTQPEESSNPLSGVFSWFTGTISFLQGWAGMLALNFSFFSDGGFGTMVGWIVRLLIGGPVIAMLLIAVFGR